MSLELDLAKSTVRISMVTSKVAMSLVSGLVSQTVEMWSGTLTALMSYTQSSSFDVATFGIAQSKSNHSGTFKISNNISTINVS